LLLALFVLIESRARAALIPVATWRRRSLVSGGFVMMGASAVMGGVFVLSSLYLQRVLGAPAWEAGLCFLPMVLAVGLAAFVGSRLVAHAGTRPVLVLGLLVAASGAILLSRVPADAGYLANLLPGLVLVGLGLGLVFVAVPITVMSRVGGDDGLASGLMQTSHEIGISLGVAVLAGVASAAAAAGGGFTAGYREALVVAGLLGVAVAVAAAVAAPNVRPEGASPPRLHGG
jgi:MFS family permease